jgi:hypothetical protein
MLTLYVEMREGEDWKSVAELFMRYCVMEKKLISGGCHEGDSMPTENGRRYAAISIPNQNAFLVDCLVEWTTRERRNIKRQEIHA